MTFITLVILSFIFLYPSTQVTVPEKENTAQEIVATSTVEQTVVHAGATKPVILEKPNPFIPENEVVRVMSKRLGANHPLIAVARCESGYRQFNGDGTLLRGKQNSQDVGVLQINEKYHLAESKRLGYDIHTLEGNIDYGEYLYNHQGLTPWNWSRHCWG